MKKLVYFLSLSLLLGAFNVTEVQAQPPVLIDIFGESFDSTINKWQMTRTITPSNATSFFWQDTIVTRNGTRGSAADTVGDLGSTANRVSSFLTSPFMMNVDTFAGVFFSFDHICYIAGLDDATVEYSFNDTLWRRIPAANYFGNSRYVTPITGELKFTKQSRVIEWNGATSNFIWDQTNSDQAWVREDFDITSLIQAESARTGGAPVNVKIRFGLYDDAGSQLGREGSHIWYIDNFLVQGGDCEPIPPVMVLFDPPENYPTRYKDRVYLTGPYQFKAQVTDNSGIVDTVYIVYQVKRDISPTPVPNWQTILVDTIGMDRGVGGNFSGEISGALPGGDRIMAGDSVCWKVEAADGSSCRNLTQDPNDGLEIFQVRPNLPPSCGTQPISDFPYYQDFNGFGQRGSTLLSDDWENVTGDFHEWWIGQGVSTTDSTEFRIFDDYPGGTNGKYLYVESQKLNSTGLYRDSTAFLQTPCIDLVDMKNGLVRFYVNMNTASLRDSLRIDIFDATPTTNFPDGRFVKNVIPAISGNKGGDWIPFEFSTFPYKNTITQIRFVGTPGDLEGKGDIGVDSFKIVAAPEIDARLNNVNLPPFVPSKVAADEEVTVNIQNLGIAAMNTITVTYEVLPDGSPSIFTSNPETFSLNLMPGDNIDLTLNEKYAAPLGGYSVRAWISGHAGDAVPSNDTISSRSRGLQCNTTNGIVKYTDDFEGGNFWTVFSSLDSLDNNWELGAPNYDFTYSTYSGENSWDILLNRPYNGNGKVSSLISPFYDFSTADSLILSFINNRDIDTTKDGVFLEFSLDRGTTWDSLRALGDPNRLKWYNNTVAAGGLGGQAVFSDNTYCMGNTWSGWLESEILLPDTFNNKEEVLFRFQFFAEFDDDGNDGMSIDNFLVYDPQPLDLQSHHFLGPTSKCDLSSQQRITTIVKNRGLEDVTSFNMKYRVTHVPTGTFEEKTDLVDLTSLVFPRPNVVEHRDTVHITSASTFNMFARGDYIVEVITQLPGDICTFNDTLTQMVEHVEGCSLQFYIETSFRPNVQRPCDSTSWRFNYQSGDRSYEITQAYNSPSYPINNGVINDTIDTLYICIKDNSMVQFRLDDRDTLIDNYSLIAFDGENDTIIRGQVTGGPDSPLQQFSWNCPPKRSASPTRIWVDDDVPQLPLAKSYRFNVDIWNNGLDSLDDVELNMALDGDFANAIVTPVSFIPELRYNRTKSKVAAGNLFLSPGRHEVCVWTRLPNGQVDQRKVNDDTLCRAITIMDTIRATNNVYAPYCDNFDDTLNFPKWIAANPQDLLRQNEISFEQGTPSTTNISSANSGSFAWVTNADGNYPNIDQSSVLSPFFLIEKDSCYGIEFSNNFYVPDSLHDGGTLQMLTPGYSTYGEDDWNVIGNSLGDTLDSISGSLFRTQMGWYNTQHVLSLPNNAQNSGWTGNSNGWKTARNQLPVSDTTYYTALRWSFASDGSKVSEGWAIDDFCIENINVTNCFPVGLNENLYGASDIYLGQNIPNPASSNTVIPYYIPRPGKVEFSVTNLLGQPVHQESMNHPSGDGLLELDLNGIAKGVYYYTMTYENIRMTNKMIITK